MQLKTITTFRKNFLDLNTQCPASIINTQQYSSCALALSIMVSWQNRHPSKSHGKTKHFRGSSAKALIRSNDDTPLLNGYTW